MMTEKNLNDEIREETAAEGSVSDENIESAKEKKEPQKPALPPHKEYAKRMLEYKRKYIFILSVSGAMIVAGIVLAILLNLWIGIAVALFGVAVYARFAPNDMYSTLGFEYKTYAEGLKITLCRARYGDVVWIPAKLIFFDVTRIEDNAFENKHNAELRCVFLPKSLLSIGKDIFLGCDALESIFFEGTREEWERIEKDTDLSALNITFEAKYPPVSKKKKKTKEKKKK